MVKRIELLKPTMLVKRDLKMENVKDFICKLFDRIQMEPYFLSMELTLVIYNFLINSSSSVSDNDAFEKTVCLIETIYERTLDEHQRNKIRNDIAFIQKRKLFTKVSSVQVAAHYIYLFFFQT